MPALRLLKEGIIEIFGADNNGEVTFRNRKEHCEITSFNEARVTPSSYDTVAGGYLEDGLDRIVRADEDIVIAANSQRRLVTKEEFVMPSWLEADLHPASNIAKKYLQVAHGPLIDPGFDGPLIVTVFNSTDEPRSISLTEPFLTIRFWVLPTD